MQRVWVALGAVLLLAGALLYFGDAASPPDGALDGIDDPLTQSGDTADTSAGGRDQPVLEGGGDTGPSAASRGLPREKAGASRNAPPAGPGEILVLSSETDAPLSEVSVHGIDDELLGATNENGVLALERIPGPGVEFRAVHEGYLPTVGKAKPGERVEVPLRPGIPVSGRVVRAGTRGNPGPASMIVWDEDLGVEIAAFTTDETGAFAIAAVRPNRPFVLTVALDGFVPLVKRLVFDVPTDDLEVLVGEGGFLTGRVHTPNDAPLANVEVRLLRAGEILLEHRFRETEETRGAITQRAARVATTRTDEDGRYTFQGVALEPAVQPVAVLKPRYVVRGEKADFAEVGQTLERDIVVKQPASLRIRVEETGGKAIGDADLSLRSSVNGAWRVLPSDERVQGDLVLKDLSPGALRIIATRSGAPRRSAYVTLEAGATAAVTLTFPRGMALEGTVKDKRGKPIWKAKVHWSAANGEAVALRTEMDGSFRFTRLEEPKGTVTVTARDIPGAAFGYEAETAEDVEAAGPALRIVLKDGTRVTGSFRELPAGGQVHGSMHPGTKHDEMRLILDADLHFVRRGPPPKRGALFVFRTRGLPPLLREEPLPFQSEEVRDLGPLFFAATNPRKGRVLGADGRPVWAAKVTVEEKWASVDVRTDRQGDFMLHRLPRRAVRIRVEAEGYPAIRTTLGIGSEFKPQVVQLRKTVRVDLLLRSSTRKSVGKQKLTLHPLFDPPEGGTRKPIRVETNRRGYVALTISPGRYRLEVDGGAGAKDAQTISVTAKAQQRLRVQIP